MELTKNTLRHHINRHWPRLGAFLIDTEAGPRIVIKGFPMWNVPVTDGVDLMVLPAMRMKSASAVSVRLGASVSPLGEQKPWIELVEGQLSLPTIRKRHKRNPPTYHAACDLLVNDRGDMTVISMY